MTFTHVHLPISTSLPCSRILPSYSAGAIRITSSSFHATRPHAPTMPTPLIFKGDKKVKKRKRVADASDADPDAPSAKSSSKALTTTTSADAPADDDSWVSADAPTDVSGPIIIVLATEPITCLACDAIGKVFCSEVENCVDGDPATSEPHDVRQVWVATRVAGTESFSLKGHHGK